LLSYVPASSRDEITRTPGAWLDDSVDESMRNRRHRADVKAPWQKKLEGLGHGHHRGLASAKLGALTVEKHGSEDCQRRESHRLEVALEFTFGPPVKQPRRTGRANRRDNRKRIGSSVSSCSRERQWELIVDMPEGLVRTGLLPSRTQSADPGLDRPPGHFWNERVQRR